jgi:hypothetical protein
MGVMAVLSWVLTRNFCPSLVKSNENCSEVATISRGLAWKSSVGVPASKLAPVFTGGGHDLAVGGKVEEFFAVAAPAGLIASGVGDLPPAVRVGKGGYINLPAATFVGGVRYPFAIRTNGESAPGRKLIGRAHRTLRLLPAWRWRLLLDAQKHTGIIGQLEFALLGG